MEERTLLSSYVRDFPIPIPNVNPDFLTPGPDGNVWFNEETIPYQGELAKITPAGEITQIPTPVPVADFVFGPDGNIWFAGTDYIGAMTQEGVLLHNYSIPSADAPALAGGVEIYLTLGPDGNIWYTEPYVSSQIVGRLTIGGQISEYTIPFGSAGAADIVTGPDGNIWFDATGENAIGRITPSGAVTTFNDPANTRVYRGLTSGPNGNLWATTNEFNTVVEFNTSGQLVATFPVSGSPYGMTEGPDGNLWYDEHAGNANNIGRMTPQGAFTEFPIPTPNSVPSIPIVGPDGNIWFAEYNTHKIGEVVLDVSTTTALTSSASTPSFGQALTLTATVTASSGSGTPAGSVDFFDTTTGSDLGSVTLSGGVAMLSTASLPVGSQTITASYGGDSPFLPSSGTITVSIGPSIIVTNATASGALTVSGNASINLPGMIAVDSSSASALTAGGNAQITAGVVDVAGGFNRSGNASFNPAPTTSMSVADPLAGLSGPGTTGLMDYDSVSFTSGAHTINPGIYNQIKVSGNASLTLSAGSGGNPGIYIIEGGGLTVTGNASLSGQNVFVYNTGSNYPGSGGDFGGITLSGNGAFNLGAPTSGTYAGVVIFQSRANTRALSFSGNAMSGISGIIYAPSALLSFSGNSQLQAALDVGTLSLSGNVALTQTAAGSDGSGDTSGIANTLLAGDLSVYINDANGLFTTDQLSRIQDAINAWDAILAPDNVTITEVSDATLANMVIDTSNTSACGGASDGVLGCFNAPNAEITMLQGWNWYAGADPSQIGANQYDFETTVLHELGHALGLGGSTNASSPMYETLASGVADRTVTTLELNIPDPPDGADPQMAAGFHPGSVAGQSAPSGVVLPAAVLGPGPVLGAQLSVLSSHQCPVTGGSAGSPVSLVTTLVVQGADHHARELSVTGPDADHVLDSVLVDVITDGDASRGQKVDGSRAVPSLPGAGEVNDATEPERIPPNRIKPTDCARPVEIPVRLGAVERGRIGMDAISESVLDELAAAVVASPGRLAISADGIVRHETPRGSVGSLVKLAATVVVAGCWGHRARFRGASSRDATMRRDRKGGQT
jgi:streptogramin lyase